MDDLDTLRDEIRRISALLAVAVRYAPDDAELAALLVGHLDGAREELAELERRRRMH